MGTRIRLPRLVLLAALTGIGSTVFGCLQPAKEAPAVNPVSSPTNASRSLEGSPARTAASPTPAAPSAAASPATAAPPASPAGPSPDPSAVAVIAAIAAAAQPLTGSPTDYDALIAQLADVDFVLLGEPSHGTHEVYEERAEITRRLIDEAGFSGLVIEGDWPDAWRVDRYVRGIGDDTTPAEALGEFDEFPEWMWRNDAFAELVGWLHERNGALPYERQAGVYGMDLYSLPESIAAVAPELRPFDAAAAARAERRYTCAGTTGTLDPSGEGRSCEQQVGAVLREAMEVADAVPPAEGEQADRAFSAVQNARIVVNGRRYAIGEGGATEPPWNIRDRHMGETVSALREHLLRTGRSGKLVIWAHNSHIGDARATDVADRGQLNLGQLVREESGVESVLVGFSTYTGTVTAAHRWGDPAVQMDVLPALPGSHPELLHEVSQVAADDFLVFLGPEAPAPLRDERLERYIGVIYLPQTERQSHYFGTVIADEYDVLIHLDETTAVRPLD